MKKRNIFIATLAILFGIFIFVSSLFSYSKSYDSNEQRVSSKSLYFGKRILPDHIFYPLLMIVDKSLLIVSTGESEVFLRIRLAQDRMITANNLLKKGDEVRALSTLTKSQKYLILATHDYLTHDNYSDEAGYALLYSLNSNTENLQKIATEFETVPTGPIYDLVAESQSLVESLSNKISK